MYNKNISFLIKLIVRVGLDDPFPFILMHLKGDAVGADYCRTSCNALTITSIHLVSLPIQCVLQIPLQRVIKYLSSLSSSKCFVPSPDALFCFSFIASATTKRGASSGLHDFISEHYRYFLLSVCWVTLLIQVMIFS